MVLTSRCGFCPPIRLTYRIGRFASPGKGDDQTRQAVPLPSRSAGTMLTTSSTRGKTVSICGRLQLLPDWLKYRRTPSRCR